MKEGWLCSKCGRGLSSWALECPCYKEPPFVPSSRINYDEIRTAIDAQKKQYGFYQLAKDSEGRVNQYE